MGNGEAVFSVLETVTMYLLFEFSLNRLLS